MTTRCPICEWPMAERREDGCVPGDCAFRPREHTPEWDRVVRNRKRLATEQEEVKGNLVFRDETGNPVAILDTSNL